MLSLEAYRDEYDSGQEDAMNYTYNPPSEGLRREAYNAGYNAMKKEMRGES